MLYVTYSHVPKAFKRFVGKNQREVTLFEAESQLKAYQAVQISSFFEMPKLEIKQTNTEASSALLKLDLKSNEVQQEHFSLASYLEEYFLSNYMDFPDFESLQKELLESIGSEVTVREKKEGKRWLPTLKKKASDQGNLSASLQAAKEYDFTQDFTEEEWALAESEWEDSELPAQQDDLAINTGEEEALKEEKPQQFDLAEGVSREEISKIESPSFLFERDSLWEIRQKITGWQTVLADSNNNIYEKQVAQFHLEREQEKAQLVEKIVLSHERSFAYFQAEKTAELEKDLEGKITAFRLAKEKEYEAILQDVEARAKEQYAEEKHLFFRKLEEEKKGQQAILERNYRNALAQLDDRLKEKERIKKEELAEKGNSFLAEAYAQRKTDLENTVLEEKQRLRAALLEALATSQKETKEDLFQKRQTLLKAFDEQTAAALSANKGEWLEDFVGMEREIQQTEKSKQHRIKAETYRLRAQEQLQESLREKDLQIAALRAEVDKVEKEYQLFMAKERAEQERKEATLETYAKEKEEWNHSFKTFLEVNSQKQKAGMVLSASSFLIMVIVLLSTLL